MASDKLHIDCPACEETFPITTYTGPNEDIDFSLDDAPLAMLSEVNLESIKRRIICIHCGCDVHLVVRFIAYAKPLSKRSVKQWRAS